jgi:hypothetical protein
LFDRLCKAIENLFFCYFITREPTKFWQGQVEKAFDYRGDLTITLKDGKKVEGYIFDREIKGPALTDCFIRVMPKDQPGKLSIAYGEIAGLAFTGRDTATGKSFAAWVKKYNEKKSSRRKEYRH